MFTICVAHTKNVTNSIASNRLLFQFAEWNNSKEFNARQMKCLHSKTSQTDKFSDKYCTRDISIQKQQFQMRLL